MTNLITRKTGKYVQTIYGEETVQAFVPHPLPPKPPLAMERLYPLLDQANQALGRLDGMSAILPETKLFLYMYVRKEAVLSSQIEGTQSSLSELLLFETEGAPGAPMNDVQEVSNYVAAMDHGLKRLNSDFPISLRLIKEIHKKLMAKGRGSKKEPGEFRTSQNWIGGNRPGNAIFVPPPANKVLDCMSDLEVFLHAKTPTLPVLIKAGLVHLQFETIHPFLDGNGRIGRLLITLMLCEQGLLQQPILYLSLYLKKNRNLYYDLLEETRARRSWETWLEFFLKGVQETAEQATDGAKGILTLFEQNRERIKTLRRASASALQLHDYLQIHPVTNFKAVVKHTNLSMPTVTKTMEHLKTLKIVRETTGGKRNRIYAYDAYLKILEQGTEPL